MIFQFLHHCLNVPDVTYSGLHFGYPVQHGNVLWNLLISQPERQISLVVFHVDDHGIQFRLIHQADQIFHSGTASLRAGDVDSLYLRPSRHAVRRSLLLPGQLCFLSLCSFYPGCCVCLLRSSCLLCISGGCRLCVPRRHIFSDGGQFRGLLRRHCFYSYHFCPCKSYLIVCSTTGHTKY